MTEETHEFEIVIQESHLDTFGHVNNATYLQIFEQARWDLITGRSYGMEKIRATRRGPVILEAHVKFRRELTNRTTVIIRSQLLEYRGKIGKLRQRAYKKSNGDQPEELACEAIFSIAQWHIDARKLIAPTPEWAYAMMLTSEKP